jgi:hypothetical protein
MTEATARDVAAESASAYDFKLQRIGAWSGIVMLVAFFITFAVIGGLIPPLSPTASAQDIAHYLAEHKLRVRLGAVSLGLYAPCIALPFLAAVTLRIHRIEGKWGILSVTNIFAGAILIPSFLIPTMLLSAATFRPGQISPEITQALDDAFWLMYVGTVPNLVVQAIVLAIAAFSDRTEPRTFPRWYGYLNIWYAILVAPGAAVEIFNEGPLSWNGAIGFWVPLPAYSTWMIATSVVILKGVKAEQAARQIANGQLSGALHA